jgi:prepilin-type N-terminal cleavage/methylation domain-containing protein
LERYWSNQKGFTLIEILFSVVLATLVLAVSYSALLFGVESLKKGEVKSQLQDKLRIASFALTQEVRYATEINLLNLSTCPTPAPGYSYICISDSSRKAIKHIVFESGSHRIGYLIEDNSNLTASYDLIFYKNITNERKLEFIIKSSSGIQEYTVQSKVNILNIPTTDEILIDPPPATYKVIQYKK